MTAELGIPRTRSHPTGSGIPHELLWGIHMSCLDHPPASSPTLPWVLQGSPWGFMELGAARREQGPTNPAPPGTGNISPSSRKGGAGEPGKPEAIKDSSGLGTLVCSLPWESSPSPPCLCSSPRGPLAEALNFNIFGCSLQHLRGEWVPGWVPGP